MNSYAQMLRDPVQRRGKIMLLTGMREAQHTEASGVPLVGVSRERLL